MINKFSIIFLIAGSASIIGGYGAILYGRKTKLFKWREYFALLLVPLVCIIWTASQLGNKIYLLFIASALFGIIAEFSLGYAYHKTLNKRLWKYDRLAIGGYTSWLTLPLWGIAGVIFWLIGKSIGA